MAMSLRFTPEDEKLIREYAKLHNKSVSDVIRQAVIEKIEDEHDLQIAVKAYQEYLRDPVTHTHDEVGKMLGLK